MGSQPPKARFSSGVSGTSSLIICQRFSLRFPRRMCAICVSDPMGRPRPRRAASTPAMNVVATAPIPGSSTASFPSAGAMLVRLNSLIYASVLSRLYQRRMPATSASRAGGAAHCKRTARYVKRFLGCRLATSSVTDAPRRRPRDDRRAVAIDATRISCALFWGSGAAMAKSSDPRARTFVTVPSAAPGDLPKSSFMLVLTGTRFGELYKLPPGRAVRIGRGEEADIRLDDEGVSRLHCSLEARGPESVLRDLGSQNGTYVGGERVQERVLVDGDRVQIGAATTFKVAYADEVEVNYQRRLAEIAVTATFGIAVDVPSHKRENEQPRHLVEHAERAMDRQKELGVNRTGN